MNFKVNPSPASSQRRMKLASLKQEGIIFLLAIGERTQLWTPDPLPFRPLLVVFYQHKLPQESSPTTETVVSM
jgi:hypothetical protein